MFVLMLWKSVFNWAVSEQRNSSQIPPSYATMLVRALAGTLRHYSSLSVHTDLRTIFMNAISGAPGGSSFELAQMCTWTQEWTNYLLKVKSQHEFTKYISGRKMKIHMLIMTKYYTIV